MNNNTFVHKYIKSLITKDDIVVDMTVGNGNDTFFLGKLAKEVIGFDINMQAIKNTYEKTKDLNNVKLIKDNHINIDKYLKDDNIKLFIFNLGYLPYGEENTITKKDETIIAFKKAYDLLVEGGYIVITFYLGHVGGKEEYYLMDKYIKNKHLIVLEKYKANLKANEPITYIIKKKSSKIRNNSFRGQI